MSLSVHGDRKRRKERPLRESPTVPPLRNPPPDSRGSFAKRKSLIARVVAKTQEPARTAERRPRGTRPCCFCPKSQFILSDKGKQWVSANRATNRAVVTLTAVRLSGKLRLYSVSAHLPKANEHADKAIGSLRKVPWVLSLSGDSFGTFLSTRREKYKEKLTVKPQFTASHLTSLPDPSAPGKTGT